MNIIRTTLLFLFINLSASAQNFTAQKVAVDDNIFLPFLKGEVVGKIDSRGVYIDKIQLIIGRWPKIASPKGFKVEFYSNDSLLSINLMPYIMDGEEIATLPGSSLSLNFNSISSFFSSPLVGDIYLAPVKVSDFFGYPVYNVDGKEVTLGCKDISSLLIPVTKEEYLKSLIGHEREKGSKPISDSEIKKSDMEIQRAYKEMLKYDKKGAEEFLKQMNDFKSEYKNSSNKNILLDFYVNELNSLSPQERKDKAYYSHLSVETTGNFSGLVDPKDSESATLLVRPDLSILRREESRLGIITIRWNLSDNVSKDSPRSYKPKGKYGFALTDDIVFELYNDKGVWCEIFDLLIKR